MSNVARVAGQAANTLSKPLQVEDVFSTFLYTGNGSTQTITNGIDLDGEGGLVWIKNRGFADNHMLLDTERGNEYLISNENFSQAGTGTSFVTTSTGFNIVGSSFDDWNASNEDYASWSFRKAPKFFDVVTYTGNGTAGRTVSHNLGTAPGCIIVKRTDSANNWNVYHRGIASDAETDYLQLNLASAAIDSAGKWNDTAPTSSAFTVGPDSTVNASGGTYVAYIFAHNDGDGDFGPDGNADIIKCGSVSYNAGATVDLGFEPQWVLIKPSSSAGNWILNDVMRGMPSGSSGPRLDADTSGGELANATVVYPTSTGFTMPAFLYNPTDLIYIAIRRPTAVPESATDVFGIDTQGSTGDGNEPSYRTTFPVDMVIQKPTDGGNCVAADRLRGTNRLFTNDTSTEASYSSGFFDYMNGWRNTTSTYAPSHAYMWKRAPNFCDVVAYTGNSISGRTVSHNLGVAPEMVWIKARNQTYEWVVHHKDVGFSNVLYLNLTLAEASNPYFISASSATEFTTGYSGTTSAYSNQSATNYIAYLFASLDGISKVGSATHSGTTNVDCGFSSGARFVLLRRTDATGHWYFWDTTRGIISGNDPYLRLNNISAQVTNTDYIDPLSSGFTITSSLTAGDYIFYAIA